MKQNIIVLFVAIIVAVFISIFYMPGRDQETIRNIAKGCNFAAVQGEEFVFRTHDASLEEYTYQAWNKSPEINSEILAYDAYVGTHGKLQAGTMPGPHQELMWFVALTETCELIFSLDFDPGAPDKNLVNQLESFTGIYFLETLEKAKSLRGKDVWMTKPYGVKKARVLFTSNPKITYPSTYLQKLHVTGVDTHQYEHTFGAVPFSLVVKTEAGEEALLPYSSRDFYETSPK